MCTAHLLSSRLLCHPLLGNFFHHLFPQPRGRSCGRKFCRGLVLSSPSSWASLIPGYTADGEPKCALSLPLNMQYRALQSAEYSFVSLLKACAKTKDQKMGSELHEKISKTRLLDTNVYVGTALVDMYAKCGAVVKAQEVFDVLPVRNVVSWNALITGYSRHEHNDAAWVCFEKMQQEGIYPDCVTFACVLASCGCAGDVEKGRKIHIDISKMGIFETNLFVGNALLNMYVKCGLLFEAQEIFNNLPVQDVVSWNALLSGYIQCEITTTEALACYEQLQHEGISPDAVTFACCLKACGSNGAPDKGMTLHARIQNMGSLDGNLTVCTALVDMYAKCAMLAVAQRVFDELSVRDVVAWSALIAGYSQNGHGEEALKYFGKMNLEGIPPNGITFASSLKACGLVGALQKGKEIHDQIEQKGWLKSDQILGNALVDMYVKCGAIMKAQEVFDVLPTRTVVSWTALITGYAQQGNFRDVYYAFNKMREDDIPPNSVTFVSLLNACSHAGLPDNGVTYFEFMSEVCGIAPEDEHHTIMIDLLSRAGQLDKATAMIKSTSHHNNIVTYIAVLGGCRVWHNVELAKDTFQLAMQLDEKKESVYVCMYNIYADAINLQGLMSK